MIKISNYFKMSTKTKKLTLLIIVTSLILICAIGIPTLARYKNRVTIKNTYVWDGTIANSYKSGNGTESNPYIISNGNELAFMAQNLQNTDYDNTYFLLSSDISLNNGFFSYDEDNGPQVTLGATKYYIKEYSNKYYSTTLREGTESGTLNLFSSLSNFKGHFDGGLFSIYGLYMTDENSKELGLFNNLQGDVKNLYVENVLIYGGDITGGLSSTTNGSSIKNVMVKGYLVGNQNSLTTSNQIPLSVDNINILNTEESTQININKNIPILGSSNISTKLTGEYVLNGANDEDVTIKINGNEISNGIININLGNEILDSLQITTSTPLTSTPTLTISNLDYNIEYQYSASGGIVGYGKNTTLENCINKMEVYANSVAGGIVGVTTDHLEIINSYNTAQIKSANYSGGLIGVVENSLNEVSITNSYNSSNTLGTINGGLIGEASNNTGEIYIENSFNAYETSYAIDTIINSSVNVTNSYYLTLKDDIRSGSITGNFNETLLSNLKTKSFITTNLLYSEFESFSDLETNPNNIWVYTDGQLPIIYIDDEFNTSATLTSGNYTWNNYSSELNTFTLYSVFNFSINDTDAERPTQTKSYFISDSNIPLTKAEVTNQNLWTTYTSPVNISSPGPHIIYVKIVDYDNNTVYLNSDVIDIKLSDLPISIGFDNYTWDSFKSSISSLFINGSKALKLTIKDETNVSDVKYYISNSALTIDELNAMNSFEWVSYNNDILIDGLEPHIIYVKAFYNNNPFYLNSDKITIGGYKEDNFTMGYGFNNYLEELNNITSRSRISFDISFSDLSSEELSSYNHNIASNILLPKNTLITIYDKVSNKIYEYKINTDSDIYNYNNSCEENDISCSKTATYPFTLFKEVGTTSEDSFVEKAYYNNGQISEKYTVFVDFSDTLLTETIQNIKIFMLLKNSAGNIIRPTIENGISSFNIYPLSTTKADLHLEANYSFSNIELNSDSSKDININSYLSYKYINETKIIDTYYEDKTMGLSIKVTDSNGDVVSSNSLKNMIFKIGEKTYTFGDDNILRINLENNMLDTQKILNITTYANSNTLPNGNYNILINNYASVDGMYYSEVGVDQITIPLVVSNYDEISNYKFDALINNDSRIIKKAETSNILFNIIENANMDNISIKVSLYKKDSLTAYNQSYTLVDFQAYVTNDLNEYLDKIYTVTDSPLKYDGTADTYNPLNLDLITNSFENTGYKFVFDLYSGNIKIGTISKYFIVK